MHRAVACVFAIGCALVACKDKSPPPSPTPPPTMATDANHTPTRTSTVRADRRVELVSVICRLAGFPEYNTTKGTPYLDSADRYFAPYAKHAAVVRARELRATKSLSYDAWMLFAVQLDDAGTVVNPAELVEIDSRWNGVDTAALAKDVAAFATDTKLDEFREQHAAYYRSLVATLEGVVAKENPVAWFDNVFGPAEASFTVIPSPIAGTRFFGVRATGRDKVLQLAQILGVMGKTGEIVVDEQLVSLLVHEMAHSYINPVFAKHEAELATSASNVFALVEKPMRAQAYGNWQTMVNESGVRAIVVNYMREKHGDAAGARQARGEHRQYFLWINELAEVMRQLAKERAANASYDLEAHMPKIVAFFDQLAKSYANGLPPMPFRGPLDAVHQRDPVWVLPANAQVAGYARMIHTQLKKTSPLVPATATTLREQKGNDLVVYGTPTDNPVIEAVARTARWKIGKDSIVLGDKTFTGPGLVLIACWYVRESPSHGVAVYAAPDAASLVGINNVRHGPNDWLVARKQGGAFVILGAGDFPRGLDDMWMLPGETPSAPPFPEVPKK
jgi:hypothetical protein